MTTRHDVQIRMPDLSPTDNEVTLVRWHVQVGETVALGQPLLEVETAKAVMDVEAVAAGVLSEVLAEPGASVLIGSPIAVIASSRPGAGSAPAAASAAPAAPAAAPLQSSRPAPRNRRNRPDLAAAAPAAASTAASDAPATGRVSFFARNRARLNGEVSPAVAARSSPATATATAPMPAATYTLTASAAASRLPADAALADAVADAALRAMASALGLTGTGVAVTGPDGATRIVGGAGAKAALLLVAVAGDAIEGFTLAADLPALAVAPPRLAVTALAPGNLAIAPRLPLALTANGAAIAPHHAARFLDSLVKELESL